MRGPAPHPWIPALLGLLLTASAPPVAASGGADSSRAAPAAGEGGRGWQWLGAPYVNADSDNGVTLGLGVGLQKPPWTAYIVNSSISTEGTRGFTWRGESRLGAAQLVFVNRIWLLRTYLYPPRGALPDWEATAMYQHTEFQLAALFPLGEHLWVGPELWSDFARGIAPEDPDGASLRLRDYPRLRSGELILGGLRARYRTTSAVRPVDGVVLDGALRAGRAAGAEWATPRFTTTADLWAGWALPTSARSRLYLRGWFRWQSEAPESERNPLGGLYTLRGQPWARDWGRRLVAARIQWYVTLVDGIPLRWLRDRLPMVPHVHLLLEAAPFADLGAVGDPDLGGWRRTRQGYGLSLRVVLEPSLVLAFDLALSPGASHPLFYFSGGEAL